LRYQFSCRARVFRSLAIAIPPAIKHVADRDQLKHGGGALQKVAGLFEPGRPLQNQMSHGKSSSPSSLRKATTPRGRLTLDRGRD
jgi:hypothetical protein